MDWVWTDTTLSLSSWMCVEDIYANIFIIKCSRETEKVPGHRRGAMPAPPQGLGGGHVSEALWGAGSRQSGPDRLALRHERQLLGRQMSAERCWVWALQAEVMETAPGARGEFRPVVRSELVAVRRRPRTGVRSRPRSRRLRRLVVTDGWVSTLCGLHLAPWFCSVKAGPRGRRQNWGFSHGGASLPRMVLRCDYPAVTSSPRRRVGSSFLFTAAGAALDGAFCCPRVHTLQQAGCVRGSSGCHLVGTSQLSLAAAPSPIPASTRLSGGWGADLGFLSLWAICKPFCPWVVCPLVEF